MNVNWVTVFNVDIQHNYSTPCSLIQRTSPSSQTHLGTIQNYTAGRSHCEKWIQTCLIIFRWPRQVYNGLRKDVYPLMLIGVNPMCDQKKTRYGHQTQHDDTGDRKLRLDHSSQHQVDRSQTSPAVRCTCGEYELLLAVIPSVLGRGSGSWCLEWCWLSILFSGTRLQQTLPELIYIHLGIHRHKRNSGARALLGRPSMISMVWLRHFRGPPCITYQASIMLSVLLRVLRYEE